VCAQPLSIVAHFSLSLSLFLFLFSRRPMTVAESFSPFRVLPLPPRPASVPAYTAECAYIRLCGKLLGACGEMCTARGGGDRAKFSQPPVGATSAEGGAAHATRKDLHCVSGQWTGWSTKRISLFLSGLCFASRHRRAAVRFSIPSRESARPSLESFLGSTSPWCSPPGDPRNATFHG